MKKRTFVLVLTVVCLIGVGVLLATDHSEATSPDYSITIEIRDHEIGLTCEDGCYWEELQYACGDKKPCVAVLDETGITGK